MPYNELRKDYLLNRWVVIARERSRRPTDFAKPRPESEKICTCPLCCGNEHMTPPAVMLYLEENGRIKTTVDPQNVERQKNWLISCIPNLYPAFSPPKKPEDATNIIKTGNFGCAIGHH